MKSTVLFSFLASLASAAVFSATTFNDISIAGGTAGNAKAEALAALDGLPADLTTVEKADIDVCNLLLSSGMSWSPGTGGGRGIRESYVQSMFWDLIRSTLDEVANTQGFSSSMRLTESPTMRR